MTAERYSEIQTSLAQDKPFILFVGTREPRKNLARLIDAWKFIADDFDLLIAGNVGWDQTEAMRWPGLKFLGQVSDEVLAVLYKEATALAYPSLDEGFGLPILESFYFGTPVVTSDLSAMKEISGEAAILVDPFSVDSIKNGLIKAVSLESGEKIHWREQAVAQLEQFSWDRAAAATFKVYQKALVHA
jgi:glycosyltransferase involved in cell wall biosynthesis